MKLVVERFLVKLETEPQDDSTAQVPPPSYSKYLRFSYQCHKCKDIHEFYTPSKGVYSESDLLKLTQATFDFGKNCGKTIQSQAT